MKKNIYYRALAGRTNGLKNSLLTFFLIFSSYPRLLLEVFIRKDFGERYFRLSSVISAVIVLAGLPFVLHSFSHVGALSSGGFDPSLLSLDSAPAPARSSTSYLWPYLTWYIYLGLFVWASVLRYQEVRRNPSVYDFARYSKCAGKTNPVFFTIQLPGQLPGRKTDMRVVETLIEPAGFFLAGVLLWLLHQRLGILLTVCSVFYSLGYMGAYTLGDNFVMDKIDEMICNEELKKSFVDGLGEDQTRGFRFMGRRPKDREMRRQILPLMIEEDEEVFEAV
jgi:hypothetical protein